MSEQIKTLAATRYTPAQRKQIKRMIRQEWKDTQASGLKFKSLYSFSAHMLKRFIQHGVLTPAGNVMTTRCSYQLIFRAFGGKKSFRKMNKTVTAKRPRASTDAAPRPTKSSVLDSILRDTTLTDNQRLLLIQSYIQVAGV